MRTKPSLSILLFAVAIIGFVVVSVNERTSAQPYMDEQCREGGSCGAAVDSQMPMQGGGHGPGRGWSRRGRMGGWMVGTVTQPAQQQCSDCESGRQRRVINGAAADGCGNQGFAQGAGCSSAGGHGGSFSCISGDGRGQGRAGLWGQSCARNAGCRSGGFRGRALSCNCGRGRRQGWARDKGQGCDQNPGRGGGKGCSGC